MQPGVARCGNTVKLSGTDFLCRDSTSKSVVIEACKSAVMQRRFDCQRANKSGSTAELAEALNVHVFDINVEMLRAIVSQALSPTTAVTGRDAKRFWYRDPENCPFW